MKVAQVKRLFWRGSYLRARRRGWRPEGCSGNQFIILFTLSKTCLSSLTAPGLFYIIREPLPHIFHPVNNNNNNWFLPLYIAFSKQGKRRTSLHACFSFSSSESNVQQIIFLVADRGVSYLLVGIFNLKIDLFCLFPI